MEGKLFPQCKPMIRGAGPGKIFKSRCRYANGPVRRRGRRDGHEDPFAKRVFPVFGIDEGPCRIGNIERGLYGNGRQISYEVRPEKMQKMTLRFRAENKNIVIVFFHSFCKFFFSLPCFTTFVTLIPIFCTSSAVRPWGRSPHFSRNARTPRPSPSTSAKINNFEFAL